MERSLFAQFIDKWFHLIVGKVTETINGKKNEEQYLFESMLTEEESVDLTWGATTFGNSIVAADVVSMDSSLPLKSRPKISNATGVLAKVGLKFCKGEKDITDINIMVARGANEANIVKKVFDDTARAIKGVKVRNEIIFEQGLSTGEALVEQEEDNATGIRVNYGYKAENIFHAKTAPWGEATAAYGDTLDQIFEKAEADGVSIARVMLSKKYFDLYRKSDEGKQLAARAAGVQVTTGSILGVANRQTFAEALEAEYGCPFQVVSGTFRVEYADGTFKNVTPWAKANIVAIPADIVGRLVYGQLAEETNPVKNVDYEKSGSYTLVSKYSKNDPLQEFTSAQALCLPVIDGADSIYLIHADSTGAISVSPDTLSFGVGADTTGKKVAVHCDKAWTVASDESWCTVVKKNNAVTVKVAANDGGSRTANVTITDAEGNTATVEVSQAGGVA